MAVLRFSFGTMGSGKSTLALQIHHNLSRRRLLGLLCTQLDRDGARVSSRLGVSAAAVDVGPKLDLFALASGFRAQHGGLDYLVCDEAQFYTSAQVEQLARVVDELGADVHALGLLTDFRGRLFPGSARFLELADERQELQVEARCWCGARATQNARLVDGRQVYDGEVVVVGDTGGDAEVSYELLCRRHWLSGETGRAEPDVATLEQAAPSLSD
jgi:thymidine kinase